MSAHNQEMRPYTVPQVRTTGLRFPNWTRFNSFYRDTPHPFVGAMLGALEAAQAQARELPIQSKLHLRRARQVQAEQRVMLETVQHLIQERRASGAVGSINDLL